MNYWDICPRCGRPPKPMMCSWFCPCEDSDEDLVGFSLISDLVMEDFPDDIFIPAGTCLYMFKDRSVAKDYADSFRGFTLIRVNLSMEPDISWSVEGELFVHKVSRNLPYEVLQ